MESLCANRDVPLVPLWARCHLERPEEPDMVELQRVLVGILCVMMGLVAFTTIQKIGADESCAVFSEPGVETRMPGGTSQHATHVIARPR